MIGETIITILTDHWGKVLTVCTGIGGAIVWLRTGRGKDEIVRRQDKVSADEVLSTQLDRMYKKITQLYHQLMHMKALIAYLMEHCPDCVPQAIENYNKSLDNE